MAKPKLQVELIPGPSWTTNVRKLLSRSGWEKIRQETLEKYDEACGICGSRKKPLHCHERWSYDEKKRIQNLEGFQCVCRMCHFVIHFGLSEVLADEGRLNLQAIIKHCLNVNNWDRTQFEKHRKAATAQYLKRSQVTWNIVVSKSGFEPLLNQARKKVSP
jgi:hypothetical protein